MEVLSETKKNNRTRAGRTLYECSHARVYKSRIYCDKGHKLCRLSHDGSLEINRLERGMPMALAVCQQCADFDSMGKPVPAKEKGWFNKQL